MACNIVFLGPSNCGKTSLITRALSDTFTKKKAVSVGTTFFSHSMTPKRKNAKNVRLHIWDMSGIPQYTYIIPHYIRNADFVVVCTDTDEPNTIERYIDTIRHISVDNDILVVLTKVDNSEPFTPVHLESYVRVNDVGERVFVTSSLTGRGVRELFQHMVDTFRPTVLSDHTEFANLDQSSTLSSRICCW